jgi:hypothetical protein
MKEGHEKLTAFLTRFRLFKSLVNVIIGEADQYRKRIRISAPLLRFRSTTRYDNTITLAFGCVLLDIFLFLVPDFRSYSSRRSPLFCLSL